MTISVRRQEPIPEGETVIAKIVKSEQVSGQFGPQLCLGLKVLKGKYAGRQFKDWSKLAVDEETGQPYVANNQKAWEIILAANGGDEKKAEKFSNPTKLEGKVIKGQVNIRGKATKRNGLQFGTISAYLDIETKSEAELDESPDNDEDDEEEDDDDDEGNDEQ